MAAIAIIDDYQNVALKMADWSKLQASHRITVFNKPFKTQDEVAKALAGFEIVNIMRERTPFPRALLERLPDLKLLITTGPRNASVDVKAANERGLLFPAPRREVMRPPNWPSVSSSRSRAISRPSSTTCAKAAGRPRSARTFAARR
jgi:hypothetical protein